MTRSTCVMLAFFVVDLHPASPCIFLFSLYQCRAHASGPRVDMTLLFFVFGIEGRWWQAANTGRSPLLQHQPNFFHKKKGGINFFGIARDGTARTGFVAQLGAR
jgi:hypothetical protein